MRFRKQGTGSNPATTSYHSDENEQHKKIADTFQFMPFVYTKVVCTRQNMEPLRVFTLRQFAEQSAASKRRAKAASVDVNLAEEQNQRFPLQSAADFVWINEFRARADILLGNSILWDDLVSDGDKTQEISAFNFKLLSSMEAGMEELHGEPNAASPICMFRSDGDSAWETEMKTLPECRKSGWHKRHLAEAELDGGLLSPTSRVKRWHIALLAAMDIKVIESLHASVRRKLRMRGQQTHGVDWMELVALWVLDRARIHNLEYQDVLECYIDEFINADKKNDELRLHPKKETKKRVRCRRTVEKKVPKKNKGVDKRSGAQRAPGRFRIFTRQVQLGAKRGEKTMNMTEVATAYKALSDDELKKLDEKAEMAKKHCRQPGGAKRVLGLNTREAERSLKRQKTQQLADTMEADDQLQLVGPMDHFNVLTPAGSSRNIAHRAMQKTFGQQRNSQTSDSTLSYTDIHQAAIQVARRANKATETAVTTWHQKVGVPIVNTCSKALLLPSELKNNMVALIGEKHDSCLVTRDAKHVSDCVKYVVSRARHTNMKSMMHEQFRQRCQPVLDADCPTIEEAEEEKQRPCLKMLVCLCSPRGQLGLVLDM